MHRIAFRTDASLQIGTGHVMRCLTLANALKAQGANCTFVCRQHTGHLLELIEDQGHHTVALPVLEPNDMEDNVTAHAHWLSAGWDVDAEETREALVNLAVDWLVVDHYALDLRWERALKPSCQRLMVVDDLADRQHDCDLLLDQNLGRSAVDYAERVPPHCRVLAGPHYALLRPEFAALRYCSLQRRQLQPTLHNLLVTMGGVDQYNATGQVLKALKDCELPADCRITVVMGLAAPWLPDIKKLAAQMPWPTEVVANVKDMAQRMADSDLAIGGAGSTAWERCCLGLPTLMVILADNQQSGARALRNARAARLLGSVSDIASQLPLAIRELVDSDSQSRMSIAASTVTDGHGVDKTLKAMEQSGA